VESFTSPIGKARGVRRKGGALVAGNSRSLKSPIECLLNGRRTDAFLLAVPGRGDGVIKGRGKMTT